MYVVLAALLLQATAEFEFRKSIRAGDVLYNSETAILPLFRPIFHRDTLATTDAGAFAMSPLPTAAGNGLAIARTSADTIVATRTGLFPVTLPFCGCQSTRAT